MKPRLIRVVFLLLLFTSPICLGVTLTVVTEEFAPCNYQGKSKIEGIASNIVTELLKEASLKPNIRLLPWQRAYNAALSTEDVLIYSMGRTLEREELFHWIGAVCPFEPYFFKLKSRSDIQLESIMDAKSLRIGSGPAGMLVDYLQSLGFEYGVALQPVNHYEYNIGKLVKNRIDLVPYERLSFYYSARKLGYKPSLFEAALKIEDLSNPLYVAASKGTSLALVNQLRKAYMKLEKAGVIEELTNQYLYTLIK